MHVLRSSLLIVLLASTVVGIAVVGVDRGSAEDGVAPATVPDADAALAGSTAPQIGWGVETVYGTRALERTGGGRGVTVAVIDTGVDVEHEDLRRRVAGCRDTTGGGVTRGRCRDTVGHGTGIAGIVAADGGPDGGGLWGVAPDARVLAYRACVDGRTCRADAIDRAIRDAADEGAEIVLLSLGNQIPHALEAIQQATDRGVLVVAASGNDGPTIGTIAYPAADRRVVGVGAVERTDAARDERDVTPTTHAVPRYSSRGDRSRSFGERDGLLEVAAPGTRIVTTAAGGGYRRESGTSFAAPFVAGLAARLWPRVADEGRPGKHDDVREALRGRAADFDVTAGVHAGPGYDPAAGVGVPQTGPPRPTIAVEPAVPTRGSVATFRATDEAEDGVDVARYEWRFPASGETASGTEVRHTFERHGRLPLHLRAVATDGTVVRTSRTLVVNAPPVARFAATPGVPLVGELLRLDARNSSDPDGDVLTYAWRIGDDGAVDDRGAVAEFRPTEPGPTTVELRVEDGDGGSDTSTDVILVNDRPSVTVAVPDGVRPGERVTLRANVTDRVGTVDVRWRRPGGHMADGASVEASFPAGESAVTVTAEDEYGARATRNVTVTARDEAAGPTGPGLHGPLPAALLGLLAVLIVAGVRRRRR
jgi:subtilisin